MTETANSEVVVTAGRFQLSLDSGVDVSLRSLPGVGPKTVERLQARGILDATDLLLFFPRAYRRIYEGFRGPDLAEVNAEFATFSGVVEHVRKPPPRGRAPLEVTVNADGQLFRLFWFNMRQRWFLEQFRRGASIEVTGAIEWERGHPRMAHPTAKVTDNPSPNRAKRVRLEPIYPQMEGIRDTTVRQAIETASTRVLPIIRQVLPASLQVDFDIQTAAQAIRTIHLLDGIQYEDPDAFLVRVDQARDRLVFEEFYTLQLELARQYVASRRKARAPVLGSRELARELVRSLPFKLTGDQNDAMHTIVEELGSRVPMRRLLQGDVGSGKTVVSFAAAAAAIGSGYQSVLMAPTEVLARQHFEKAHAIFDTLGVRVGLLTGSTSVSERAVLLESLKAANIDLLVGTHAVFQSDVVFADGGERLGLVIIDEQHKFGVEQRDALLAKGDDPHFIAMTATPIPRSLAHAYFGDLDLTVLKDKPPGRKPIRTVLRTPAAFERLYAYARERVDAGEQVFVVFPLIEASETSAHRSNVMDRAEVLANGPFQGVPLGILHGRMSADDKSTIMRRFRDGEVKVLCSTTVIEVGVDVPQATLMIIESAEVFGLSQLHQLRGRVGRSDIESMCVVVAGYGAGEAGMDRLNAFTTTDDGFALAEVDLVMRGAGLLLGARQAGRSEFRFGDVVRDAGLLEKAHREARRGILGDAGH